MSFAGLQKFMESKAGVTLMLFTGLLAFSAAVVTCAAVMPQNDRIYVYLTGIGGNFSGALFTYLTHQRISAKHKEGGDVQ